MPELGDLFKELDRPRPMPANIRERLETALAEADLDVLDAIDSPRAMPEEMKARIERRIIRRWNAKPRLTTTTVAGAAALLLLLNSIVLVAGRQINQSDPRALPIPTLGAPPSQSPLASPPAPVARPEGSLLAFGSSSEFLSYIRKEALKIVGPYGMGGMGGVEEYAPAPGQRAGAPASATRKAASSPASGDSSAASSSTNVQEQGVDEPDLVDTDGRTLVTMTEQKVWVFEVSNGVPALRGSVDLPHGLGIFLSGKRLIHLAPSFEERGQAWTKVTVLNLDKPSTPQVSSSIRVEGGYVGARLVGDAVRLVVQSPGLGPQMTMPAGDTPVARFRSESANRNAIIRSELGDWLPDYVLERPGRNPRTGLVQDGQAVQRPPEPAGLSMVTVVTIDPADPTPKATASVLGAGEIVYSSVDGLYVTSSRWDDLVSIQEGRFSPKATTSVHKFKISDPTKVEYIGSGEVPGYLLNQFSMSEHEGLLRVASTLAPSEISATSESFVTVLAEEQGRLAKVGSVGNLGRGERIYSVRFIGPLGYVVTFRQTDPLYVVDLKDPSKPVVRGELKVPGFSEYLHPIEPTLLMGVGRAATDEGRTQGLQVSLFDVSNPNDPRRLHARQFGSQGYSEVGSDHHAFLYWGPRQLAVLPASISGEEEGAQGFTGALAFRVDKGSGFGEPARLTHSGRSGTSEHAETYDAAFHNSVVIRRSLVVGRTLITFSNAGLLATDLDSFTDIAWVRFPN